MEFLFGKVMEGTKLGTLWAVNRPFLLEKKGGHWRILVYLRAVLDEIWQNPLKAQEILDEALNRNLEVFEFEKTLAN